jgi:hypothetical protein
MVTSQDSIELVPKILDLRSLFELDRTFVIDAISNSKIALLSQTHTKLELYDRHINYFVEQQLVI